MRYDILYLIAGVEDVIPHEPDVTDPKCGVSNMNIPPNRIHLVGVPGLKSKNFQLPYLAFGSKPEKVLR